MIDDADRHEIYLSRLTTQLLNSHVYPSLAEAYKAARSLLLDAESIDSIRVLQRLQKEIGKAATEELTKGWDDMTVGLEEMAAYEAEYSAKLTGAEIGAALSVPAADKVKSFIDKSIITLSSGQRVTSGTWAEYVNGSIDSAVRQYNGIIATGYQNGQTVNQMAKSLLESTQGLLKSQAESLARTGQSHYANQAREAMALDNAKVVKYRVFVATFDNRTTLQCRALNGKNWAITDGSYPRLPLHFGERSIYVYTDDPKKVKHGKRAAVGGNSGVEINPNRKLKYRGKKDKDIFNPGQISAGETMDQWMRRQPDWFIDDSLGETRAKLFKSGGLSLTRFADVTGRPLTLEELRELDAAAFKKAGIK
jgi:SPP1 gp7 family putative phage head morphogenesis protein